MKFDLEVDAIGLKCPLPILYCKRGLNSISDNQILKIKTTDKVPIKISNLSVIKPGTNWLNISKKPM